MTDDAEAMIRAAVDAFAAAIVAAIRAEAAPAAPDRLLDVGQASTALSLGRSLIYAEIAAGRLRSVKVGRRRLIPAAAVSEFIRERGA